MMSFAGADAGTDIKSRQDVSEIIVRDIVPFLLLKVQTYVNVTADRWCDVFHKPCQMPPDRVICRICLTFAFRQPRTRPECVFNLIAPAILLIRESLARVLRCWLIEPVLA